jgi:uncharacterized protein involved in exopolysaccharide biosynthesis
MRFAARLYPAAWRARYGEEFEALLEDTGPVGRDVWDVMEGALKMQMVTWSSWKLVPALGVAGAIAMGVASLMIQTEYVSSGVMRVTPQRIPEGKSLDLAMAQRVEGLRTKALSRRSLVKIVAEENLYPREREKTTLEDAVAQMQRDVQFWPVSEHGGYSAAFELSFRYPDPYKAQRVTRQLISQMVDANILVMMEAKGEHSAQVEVLDPASLPGQAIFPNRPFMIVVGLTAGLLVGCLYVARHSWKWLAPSAVVGALLAVVVALAMASYRPNSHPAFLAFAILGFLAGLSFGLAAVGLRRWRIAR